MFKGKQQTKLVEMFSGVTRRTMNSGERTTLAEIEIAQNATVPGHTHPHEQIGYVVSGRVRFRIGDEVRELAAGDSYLIPGGMFHEVTGLEHSVCIDIFSPVREEFLD